MRAGVGRRRLPWYCCGIPALSASQVTSGSAEMRMSTGAGAGADPRRRTPAAVSVPRRLTCGGPPWRECR